MTDLEAFRQEKDDFFGTDPDSPLTPDQQAFLNMVQNAGGIGILAYFIEDVVGALR